MAHVNEVVLKQHNTLKCVLVLCVGVAQYSKHVDLARIKVAHFCNVCFIDMPNI